VSSDATIEPQKSELKGAAVRGSRAAIFVTNQYSNAVTIYPKNGNGDIQPLAAIGDPFALFNPQGLAVDAASNIYVPNQETNSIAIYSVCQDAVTPFAVISGPDTGLASPFAVALDNSGSIYAVNGASVPGVQQTILRYPPLGTKTGAIDHAPIAGSSNSDSQFNPFGKLAIGPDSKIYVIRGSNSIDVYPPLIVNTGIVNESPVATISGPATGLDSP
jgi:hypothetical protein